MKVLTPRPRYIEPATVREFGGETSSATEAKEPALMQNTEESAAMSKASLTKLGHCGRFNEARSVSKDLHLFPLWRGLRATEASRFPEVALFSFALSAGSGNQGT